MVVRVKGSNGGGGEDNFPKMVWFTVWSREGMVAKGRVKREVPKLEVPMSQISLVLKFLCFKIEVPAFQSSYFSKF